MKGRLFLGICMLGVFVAVLICVPITASAADVDVAIARIDRIGVYNPNQYRTCMVQLTDLSTSPAWAGSRQFFLAKDPLGNTGVATVLTAYSMGKTLWVRITNNAAALSLITVVYINN